MARPLRLPFAGGVYHVTARGNERKAIVRDDTDRARFVDTPVAEGNWDGAVAAYRGALRSADPATAGAGEGAGGKEACKVSEETVSPNPSGGWPSLRHVSALRRVYKREEILETVVVAEQINGPESSKKGLWGLKKPGYFRLRQRLLDSIHQLVQPSESGLDIRVWLSDVSFPARHADPGRSQDLGELLLGKCGFLAQRSDINETALGPLSSGRARSHDHGPLSPSLCPFCILRSNRTDLHSLDSGRRLKPIEKHDEDTPSRLIGSRIRPCRLHTVGSETSRQLLAPLVFLTDQYLAINPVSLLDRLLRQVGDLRDPNPHHCEPVGTLVRPPPVRRLAPGRRGSSSQVCRDTSRSRVMKPSGFASRRKRIVRKLFIERLIAGKRFSGSRSSHPALKS